MIAPGRKSKCFFISLSMTSISIFSVSKVSIETEMGWAIPIAYDSWSSRRSARPAATAFLAA